MQNSKLYKSVNINGELGDPCTHACDLHCLLDFALSLSAKALIRDTSHFPAIEHRVYEPGEHLFRRGDHTEFVVSIRSGLVKLVEFSSGGAERIILLGSIGTAVGLRAILDEPMRHDAVALRRTETCRIPILLLKRLGECEPDVYLKLMFLWQKNLDFADQNILSFSTGTVISRVARLIMFMRDIEPNGKAQHFTLPNREDMAALLGVVPESVCRAVAQLKRSKVLWKVKRDVYQCDWPSVEVLACLG